MYHFSVLTKCSGADFFRKFPKISQHFIVKIDIKWRKHGHLNRVFSKMIAKIEVHVGLQFFL